MAPGNQYIPIVQIVNNNKQTALRQRRKAQSMPLTEGIVYAAFRIYFFLNLC